MSPDAILPSLPPSLWRRLRYTPLRDVLRGRLSGRLDIDTVMAQAALPANLESVVRRTVRGTRLSRIEKSDVARELVAHFRDGLADGASSDKLATSFGDTGLAAALIRRGKLRSRPAAWKLLTFTTRMLGWLLLLLIVAYGYLALRLWTARPVLSRNHLAELNAPALAVPEQDRAWPAIEAATRKLERLPNWATTDHWQPTSPRWPELVAFAHQNAVALDEICAALHKPHLGVILGSRTDSETSNPMLVAVEIPQLGELRDISGVLRLDALVAGANNDGVAALRDVLALAQMGRFCRELPFIISDLVGDSIMTRGCAAIGELLDRYPSLWSNEQLIALSHAYAGLDVRVRVATERRVVDDLIQRLYSDDGRGDGRLSAAGLHLVTQSLSSGFGTPLTFTPAPLAPLASAVIANRAEMQAKSDQMYAMAEVEAALPLWERGQSRADQALLQLKQSPLDQVRFLPLTIMIPVLSNASAAAERDGQFRDATLVAIALELYQREHRTWPASLDELTPLWMPVVPPDRFDGHPLRYILVDGKPRIYSTGVDRDDDGGRPPVGETGNRRAAQWQADVPPRGQAPGSAQDFDGDWVLWPPIYETPCPRESSEK